MDSVNYSYIKKGYNLLFCTSSLFVVFFTSWLQFMTSYIKLSAIILPLTVYWCSPSAATLCSDWCLLCSLIGAISVWAYPENSLRHLFNSCALLSTWRLSHLLWWLLRHLQKQLCVAVHWSPSLDWQEVHISNQQLLIPRVIFLSKYTDWTDSIPLIDTVCSLHFSFTVQIALQSKNKLRCILMRWIL